MDDLQFRRKAYADPNCKEADFLQAVNEDKSRQESLNSIKALDHKIIDALNVDVPSSLAENLILRQQIKQHSSQIKKTRVVLALAASIAFVAGVSFTLIRNIGPVNLNEHAIAHIYHDDNALTTNQDISIDKVNQQLVSLIDMKGAHFTQQPGKVYFSSFCDFQGVKSLHLVMQGKESKVTLFIVPEEERMHFKPSFEDDKYQGIIMKKDGTYMILVGENKTDLNYVKKELEGTFI